MSESTFRVGDEPDDKLAVDVDDLFAPPTSEETSGLSALESLRQALAAPVERAPLTLRVPTRPGVTLRFIPNIDDERRKSWQNRATKKSRRQGKDDEVNEMLFAQLVLANTHVATCFGGVDAHDDTDAPLTFAHRQLWDMVGATDPQSCIRKLFANDAHVLIASGEVLLASGFEDDLEDPTEG